jgi:glycosyltransferase involved in cell wall biosynthesis
MLLSACLIVKNEAHCLPRCLSSLQAVADELIVADTGSHDTSVEIASQYQARVVHFTWQNHFGLMRNQALALAQGDWILSIDADEWLEPADAQALIAFLSQAPPAIYVLRWQQHPDLPFTQKAVLFPNFCGVSYLGRVHELPWDKTGQLPLRSLRQITLSHAPNLSPLDPIKVEHYRQLLALDLDHADLLERFHGLRHWGQSELILKQDQAAKVSFEKAWLLVPNLPLAARDWGMAVLESLLFLACEAQNSDDYAHWRNIYAQVYPQSLRLELLPEHLE